MSIKPIHLAAYPVLAILGTSCTPFSQSFTRTHVAYRTDLHNTGDANRSTVHKINSSTTLGYLEFDDQGEPWRIDDGSKGSVTQLPTVLNELRQQVKNGPVRVMIFIHGWNNNAAPYNGNLESFKASLAALSKASDGNVFGIYVGWRGKLMKRNIYVDVSSREATAARVGRSSLMMSLRAISSAAHERDGNRVVAVGHSFGAKILTQITVDHLAAQIGKELGEKGPAQMSDIRPLADTVILANTAESANLPLQIMNIMRDYKVTYTNQDTGLNLPLMVSLSSTGDTATKYLLPAWNKLSRDIVGLPHKGGVTSSNIQREALYRSMGYFEPIQSHRLYDENGRDATGGKITWDGSTMFQSAVTLTKANANAERTSTKESIHIKLSPNADAEALKDYQIKRIYPVGQNMKFSDEGNFTPFWGMQLPTFVSGGHNDIWNPNFVGIVTALEAIGTARPRTKERVSNENNATLKVTDITQ